MESFAVVDLIENNPISKLTSTYQNKLLTKIKEKFNESEQQLFVASFYGFLKYDPNNDFVIDLDDVWKWVGFSNKAHSIRIFTFVTLDYFPSYFISANLAHLHP